MVIKMWLINIMNALQKTESKTKNNVKMAILN